MSRIFPRPIKRVVIKIGSSVMATYAMKPKTARLSSLVQEISLLRKKNIDVVAGQETERQFSIRNNEDTSLSLSLSTFGLGNAVTFEEESISLNPGDEKEIKFIVNVNKKGLVVGKILIMKGESSIKEIPVVINVRSENFLFDSSITIPTSYKKVERGDKIVAQINLQQVGLQKKVDVTATYTIEDFQGNNYLQEKETFFVLEDKSFLLMS